MSNSSEITALLHLIDDPDEVVFETVCNRFITLGKPVLDSLEAFGDQVDDALVQQRIALVMHKVYVGELEKELVAWSKDEERELLDGAVLLSKYVFPHFNALFIYQEMERLKRSIWLEINSYLTPLEKINIVNTIIFKFFNYQGSELNFKLPEDFTLSALVNHKRGNSLALGVVYACLAKMLDLPLYIIKLPNQNLLAYFNRPFEIETGQKVHDPKNEIAFYVNPVNGRLYNWENVFDYLKKEKKIDLNYFKPQSASEVLKYQMEQLAICYRNDDNLYKYYELLHLCEIIAKDKMV